MAAMAAGRGYWRGFRLVVVNVRAARMSAVRPRCSWLGLSWRDDMETYKTAVLTVIAIALCAIALENSGVLPAHAYFAPPLGTTICSQPQVGAPWNCAQVVNGALLVHAE
jgi:hypothetical protein